MNYHLEHHMFPLVPYHQLPRLHAIVKDDCPAPYRSLTAAYREIVPAMLRQIRDPGYFRSPQIAANRAARRHEANGGRDSPLRDPIVDGWVDVCASEALTTE